MLWALRRRIIIIAIAAAVILAPAFYFFLSYKSQQVFTCTDNKKNGDEVGIDCGGSCVRMCREDVAPLVVDWVAPVKVTDDVYHMAALIENRNLSASPLVNYTLSLYDKDNLLVSERTGSTYVPANTSFIISELLIPVGKRLPKFAFITLNEASYWQQVDQRQLSPFLKTGSLQWTTTETGSRLEATIKNTERVDIADIDITAVAYDKNDNVIALSTTTVDHLAQSEVAPLVFTWPSVVSPDKTSLYVRQNPFLNKSIALPMNPQYHQR